MRAFAWCTSSISEHTTRSASVGTAPRTNHHQTGGTDKAHGARRPHTTGANGRWSLLRPADGPGDGRRMEIRHRGAAPRGPLILSRQNIKDLPGDRKEAKKLHKRGWYVSVPKPRSVLCDNDGLESHTGRRRTAPGRGGYFGENHIRSLGGTVPRPGYGVCPRDTDAGSTALRSHLGALRKPAYPCGRRRVHTRSQPFRILRTVQGTRREVRLQRPQRSGRGERVPQEPPIRDTNRLNEKEGPGSPSFSFTIIPMARLRQPKEHRFSDLQSGQTRRAILPPY